MALTLTLSLSPTLSLAPTLTLTLTRSPADGGQLRAYTADGPRDIESLPGTLVLFDSATVPHEVLPTRRERHVCVGWLLEDR